MMSSFTFITELSNNYYFFNSSEDVVSFNGEFPIPKIGFYNEEILILNLNFQAEKDYEVKITKLVSDIEFNFFRKNDSYIKKDLIRMITDNKSMIIIQPSQEFICYENNLLNKKDNKLKYAQFNNEMNLNDILEGNDKFFKTYTNNDSIIHFSKNEIQIIFFDFSQKEQIHYFLGPKEIDTNIDIINAKTNFIFLEKNKEYELNFENNKVDRMIKLSRKTPNSQIYIVNEDITLDSNNIYYQIKEGFKGKLNLIVNNSDAMIEFLFKIDDAEIINFKNNSMHINNLKFNLIKISKEHFSKNLQIKLEGEETLKFKVFFGYSIPPYSYYYFGNSNQYPSISNKENIDLFIDEVKLMNDEYYCVLFENLGDNISFIFSEEESQEKEDGPKKDEEEKKEDLEGWKIALIVIGSILAMIIIIIIIIYFVRKNKQITNESIEDKMQNLTNIRD